MRYLDRAVKRGDRVRVEFDAVVDGVNESSVLVSRKGANYSSSVVVEFDHVRVIAPEPAVGDEWTPDVHLPAGSIIESGSETARCNPTGSWGSALVDAAQLVRFDSGPWRIVRIGNGS